MDKLLLKRKTPERKYHTQNRVRLTDEAINVLEEIQTECLLSLTEIASEMILFAKEHTEIISSKKIK